jgi:excisionase family DNA binding protein
MPVPEAAHKTGIGTSTMWDLIRQGLVETATLGRRRLVVRESLEKLIEQRRAAPKAPLAAPPVGRGRRPRRAAAA